MNRKVCKDCTEKHTAVAYFLLLESLQGYPEHVQLAEDLIGTIENVKDTILRLREILKLKGSRRLKIIGALSEAADECVLDYPHLAEFIRSERLKYTISPSYEIDFDKIEKEIAKCM